MRILLVQPRVSAERAYPLGLATLVPGLERHGHRVQGCDLGFDSLESLLERTRAADVVGFHLPSAAVSQVQRAVRALRARGASALPVVVGGPHATLFPARALEQTGADAAVVGEAEVTLPRLIDALARGDRPHLPGVTWASAHDDTAPVPQVVDLDAQPFADRLVFPIARYTHAMRSAAVPYTTVVTSRGCLGACPFCPGPRLHPGGFRARSPRHVYGELETLVRTHGIRAVHIEDDDFFADRQRVLELCDLLRRKPLPLVWEVVNGVPPERLDRELLSLVALAGCRTLVLSVEIVIRDGGGGPTVRTRPDGAPVAYGLETVRRLVAAGHRAGITMAGYFMVGMPGRRVLQDLSSIVSSYRLGLDRADYSVYQPVPGARDWFEHQGERSGTRRSVAALRLAAQVGFYLHPVPFHRLIRDLTAQPRVLEAVVRKVAAQVGALARRPA